MEHVPGFWPHHGMGKEVVESGPGRQHSVAFAIATSRRGLGQTPVERKGQGSPTNHTFTKGVQTPSLCPTEIRDIVRLIQGAWRWTEDSFFCGVVGLYIFCWTWLLFKGANTTGDLARGLSHYLLDVGLPQQ